MRRVLLNHPTAFAGLWFLAAAMIPLSAFAIMALPAALLAPHPRYCVFLFAAFATPLFVAFVMGFLLAGPIADSVHITWSSATLRGVTIAFASLLSIAVIFFIDVHLTDYSSAVETSRERSQALAQGLLIFVSFPVLFFGALASWILRWYAGPGESIPGGKDLNH